MCNCINEVAAKARETIKNDVESKHSVAQWLTDGVFDNMGFGQKNGFRRIGMPFIAEYRLKKKDGFQENRIRKKTVLVYPTFCPFCGEKYEEA